MSDYTPITGKLRDAMCQWGWTERDGSIMFTTSPIPSSIDAEQTLAISGSDFDRLCDAIDAIHAQLERENAALKAELDRVTGEQEEHAHARGDSITGELRDWYKDRIFMANGWQEINDIADRIDVEHELEVAEAHTNGMYEGFAADKGPRDFIELPKDADGVPIHVGDVLDGYGKTIEVVEMRHGRSGWVLISRDGNGYADTFAFSHHHEPTVEDVLREFALKVAGEECMTMRTGVVEEYAAKMREVLGE